MCIVLCPCRCPRLPQVPVQVAYLDRSGSLALDASSSGSSMDVDTYTFVPEACPQGTQPRVSLLYRCVRALKGNRKVRGRGCRTGGGGGNGAGHVPRPASKCCHVTHTWRCGGWHEGEGVEGGKCWWRSTAVQGRLFNGLKPGSCLQQLSMPLAAPCGLLLAYPPWLPYPWFALLFFRPGHYDVLYQHPTA